jgi:hypothetical protein
MGIVLGRIFVAIGGLLVVALFAALIAPYFIDWTNFRRDFEKQASRIIGKKVVVHGAVDARILPFPSVTLNDVRVGEDSAGDALVTAKSFSMESELAPFLSGEALIYNMRIDSPKLRMRLTEDGTLDWVRTGTPEIPASTVILENVTVTSADVLFIDEQTGRNRHITNLDMDLSAKTLAGPWRVAGKGAIDGRTGSFVFSTSLPDKGKVPLKLRLLPDNPYMVAELDGVIGLNDFRPEYKGRFNIREKLRSETVTTDAAVDNQKSAAPRLAGKFELLNDRLRIPEYEFKMGDPTDPYLVTGEATVDAGRTPEFLLTAVGQQVDMSRFGANSEGASDAAATPLIERVRALLTLAADIPIPALPGKADISLPALIAGDTVIREIRVQMHPAADGWEIENAEAQLPGRTTLSAKGQLTLLGSQSFEGDLLLASNQPSGFAEWVTGGVPDAIRRLKSAGFSAKVNLTPELQRFEDLEIAFGSANLRGRLEHAQVPDHPPTMSVDLTGNAFDLETMVALGGLMTGVETPSALAGQRIAAKLKVEHFRAFDLDATGLDASFSVVNGALGDIRARVEDFYGTSLDIKGGIAEVSGTPKGGGTVRLSSLDPTAFLQLLAERLPSHPMLDRLAASARYFTATDVTLDLKLGLGDWPIEAKLSGSSNGSAITANLVSQTTNLANPDDISLDARIENPQAWVLLGQAGFPTLEIDADDNARLDIKIDAADEAQPEVAVEYTAALTTVNVEGPTHLTRSGFLNGSYKVTVDAADIAPYLMMTGIALPDLVEGVSLNATADAYVSAETVNIGSLKGVANENKFNGTLSYLRNATSPQLSGDLTLNAVDFRWLADAIYGPVIDGVTGRLARTDVPSAALLPLDADIRVAATALHLGSLGDVKQFNGIIRSTANKLEIADATGQLEGGNFSGRAELGNIDGNAFLRTQVKLTGTDIAPFVWSQAGKPVASALANLSFALDTTGKTPASLLDSATGSGTLSLSDLTVSSFDAAALTSILALADSTQGDIVEANIRQGIDQTISDGTTHIDTLEIPFNIAGGRLRAANIAGQNETLSFSADADIGLMERDLTSRLTVEFKPGEDAQAGADPAIDLSWKGPFAAPTRQLDITTLTSFLSLRRFEQERRRVEIMQANIAEKQRLRREAALYRALDAERERLKQRALDNERLLQEAQEALKKKARDEAEAKRKASEADKGNATPDLTPTTRGIPEFKLDLSPGILQ